MEKKFKQLLVIFLLMKHVKNLKVSGVPYKLNLLFHGYPGTGKTSLVYSIASEPNMNVALLIEFYQKNGGQRFYEINA